LEQVEGDFREGVDGNTKEMAVFLRRKHPVYPPRRNNSNVFKWI
jgi:hypothetical protein